jgi:hypothetical protein
MPGLLAAAVVPGIQQTIAIAGNRAKDGGKYEAVAASQTDQVLGATGAVGDYLKKLIVTVATSATGTCSIKDGNGSALPITAANTPIGVYEVNLEMIAANPTTPGWKVTTGAGATVVAVGDFT